MSEELVEFGLLKRKFEDQITCCICWEQYEDPKMLPCNHCFCLKCIVQMKNRANVVKCPVCRKDNKLTPQGGAASLPSAFHINTMIDLHKGMEEQPFQTCSKHNDPLKVYCETCCEVICRDCAISMEHNKHTYHLISECYSKHFLQIKDNLGVVERKKENLVKTIFKGITNREKQIVQQGENIKEEISAHAQQLINNILQSQEQLIQQVDIIVQQKNQSLAVHRQHAQKLHTQLETCQDVIERNLNEWNQQRILTEKNTLIDEMKKVIQEVEQSPVKDMEDFALQFKKIDFKDTEGIGKIAIDVLDNVSVRVTPCRANRRSITSLSLYSQDGTPLSLPPSLISSTLSTPGGESLESNDCSITETQPGEYSIEFTPFTKKDQLIVQVGGVDVPNSPFTLPVIPTPQMRGDPVRVITGLNKPHGIALCDNGDIVVAENGAHCVTIMNKTGEKVKSFGERGADDGQFTHPSRVAISADGHILVTDNRRLQKLTTGGIFVRSISGNESNERGQFNYPEGIAVHPISGLIFIADSFNNRIQVFTNDLSYDHTINPGFIFRRLKNPSDVALDDKGFVYVADGENNCIRKLTTDKGKLVGTYGSRGSTPGRLSAPSSLLIHDDHLYISEWGNHRVSVFTTDGKFVHCFSGYGKGEDGTLHGPHGITVNPTTHELYICDTKNNRIVVF